MAWELPGYSACALLFISKSINDIIEPVQTLPDIIACIMTQVVYNSGYTCAWDFSLEVTC